MRVLLFKDSRAEFIHCIAEKRKFLKNWYFLHIKITDISKVKVEQIIQSLKPVFADDEPVAFQIDDHHEVVIVAPNKNRQSLALVEKSVIDVLPPNTVRVISNTLAGKGVDQISKLLAAYMPATDDVASVGFKRMARTANVFLVLDDDIMVLKQMQKILQGFGHVELAQSAEEFMSLYKQYAPNVTFVDIHLNGERGTQVLDSLLGGVDPFAHVVMISSDSMKNTVLESKSKGAGGYIMKPLDRDTVCRHILKAPTFTSHAEPA